MANKIFRREHVWTFCLLLGLVSIYVGTHWQKHPAGNSSTVAAVYTQQNSQILTIPSLGISAPIVYSSSNIESKIQTDLQSGVAHLSGTANVGDVGNAFIVGHSSNYKNAPGNFNEVFAKLPEIKIGDQIRVRVGSEEFDYTVTQTHIVQPTELWVESQETDGAKILTLQTSYPVGTAKQRFIVVSKLAGQ